MTHPKPGTNTGRFRNLHAWWKHWGNLVVGVGLLIVAIVVAVIAFQVKDIEQQTANQRAATAVAARSACMRAREFGPRLIDFYERSGVLSHRESAQYRRTIPKTCPGK